jgi:hypothetical protein
MLVLVCWFWVLFVLVLFEHLLVVGVVIWTVVWTVIWFWVWAVLYAVVWVVEVLVLFVVLVLVQRVWIRRFGVGQKCRQPRGQTQMQMPEAWRSSFSQASWSPFLRIT